MCLSDPIADFLTRLRNASAARHRHVDVMWSKLIQNIAEVMKESLLEGNADYGDVMDAVGKLKSALNTFEHSYPASRTSSCD